MIDKIIEYLEREVSIRKIVLHADEHGSCKSYIKLTNEMREMITYLKSLKTEQVVGYKARRERDMRGYKGVTNGTDN